MKEEFKTIENFPNYEVSNLGRVRNKKTGRIRKGSINRDGYKQTTLRSNNKLYSFYIHRLVAQTFIPNPNNLPEVNHKDENPANNQVLNLEWCTSSYNNNYGTRNKRASITRSKPVIQFDLNGNFIREWRSAMEIQRELGYANQNICSCCKGRSKTACGFKWEYKKKSAN